MKLYTWGPAPNPRRVRIFVAEKGMALEVEDVGERAQLKPDFLARSSHRLAPMLELDDGTLIGEAMAICRYLDGVQPEPRLFGSNPTEMALVDMWERKCEFEGLQAVAEVFRNTLPAFEGRGLGGFELPIPQIPALIERGKLRVQTFYAKLDQQLEGRSHIASEAFSVADITGLCAVDFARRMKLEIPESCSQVRRWYDQVSARPSAKA
jgi:glutathione S-transferase